MAGSQDGAVMTVAQAKARLHEVGQNPGAGMKWLASPLLRTGLIVAVGAIAAKAIFGRRGVRRDNSASSGGAMSRAVIQALLAAAPMLIKHFIRSSPRAGDSSPASPVGKAPAAA